MRVFISVVLAAFVACGTLLTASAEGDPAPSPSAQRFPQPVRAGDLPGRLVLEPKETQPVLGHVVSVVRQADGRPALVIRLSGWHQLDLFGTREVLVSTDQLALMGEHVAAMDIKPDALNELETFSPGSLGEIPQNDKLLMGIVGPFH